MTKDKMKEKARKQIHSQKPIFSKKEEIKKQFSAYEAPTIKEFLLVLLVVLLLIVFSWIAYYKFGWFH